MHYYKMVLGPKVSHSQDGKPCIDASLYQSIVGSMQYLAFTWHLAFAIHKVSKFIHNSLESHWQAIKGILFYLNIPFQLSYSSPKLNTLIFKPFLTRIELLTAIIDDQ